jgi:hypothetical protein
MTTQEMAHRMGHDEYLRWKRFLVQFKILARPSEEANDKPVDEMTEAESMARVREYNAMRAENRW